MQASRNANDLWLSFWVSHVEPQVPSAAEHGLLSPVSQVHTSALMTLPTPPPACLEAAFCVNSFALLTPSLQHVTSAHSQLSASGSNSSWHPDQLQGTHVHVPTQLQAEWKPVHVLSRALAQPAQNLQVAHSALTPATKFYLYILFGIAAANSVFTLVRCDLVCFACQVLCAPAEQLLEACCILCRAFSFAFGGLVAAQGLHEQLLQAVIRAPCR